MNRKFVNYVISTALCSMLVIQSVAFPAYAEGNDTGDFNSALNQVVSDYCQNFPQYEEGIISKADGFRGRDSYEEYYKESPAEAMENVTGVLDCYVDYRKRKDNISDNQSLGDNVCSTCAVTGDQWEKKYYVNTPLIMQDNGYYCGPACVYMTVEGIRNHMPSCIKTGEVNSQEAHAEAMKTSPTTGTSETALNTRLSNMLEIDYNYYWKYMPETGELKFTSDEFAYYIKNSLNINGPVVLMIHPNELPAYKNVNYSYDSDHCVVVCAEKINNRTGEVTYVVNDPNNLYGGVLNKTYVLSADDLYSCFKSIYWMKWY